MAILFLEIIYIMALRGNNNIFLTPDRRPLPDTATKGFSTTADRGILKKLGSEYSPPIMHPQINRRIFEAEESNPDKLSRLQSRVDKLRAYLNQTPKIEKRRIREIFNWNDQAGSECSEERKLLKELGSKVRGLIKQNCKLKHVIYTGEVSDLRLENQRLKSLLENVYQGEAKRNKIMIEENGLLRNFIQNTLNQEPQQKHKQNQFASNSNPIHNKQVEQFEAVQEVQEQDEQKQPLFNENLLSLDRLNNLKNYFTLYVNTAIEENEEKFASQQKYINALEKRLTYMETIDGKLEHFKFQNKVKLQQSSRKSKNFTANAPKVYGDTPQNELLQEQQTQEKKQAQKKQQAQEKKQEQRKKPQVVKSINYYSYKERTIQNLAEPTELELYILQLREQNSNLKIDLQDLKDKYEVQIEKHIRDISQRQQLLIQISRVSHENKLLRKSLEQLSNR